MMATSRRRGHNMRDEIPALRPPRRRSGGKPHELTGFAGLLSRQLAKLEKHLVADAESDAFDEVIREDNRLELIRASGVEPVLTDAGLRAVLRRDEGGARAPRALELTRAWMSPASQHPILVLFGGTGVGKTVAAAWALSQRPGHYVEAETLCKESRSHFGGPSPEFWRYVRSEFLVIDELGMEHSEDLAAATLHEVVNRRQRLPKRTLLLGNLNRAQWTTRYDSRTRSRLQEVGVIRRVDGMDLRSLVGEHG